MPTTPGRMPSVTHARVTKWPMPVFTFTRSPCSMPSFAASPVAIQSGLLCEISYSHFTGERVWISVGSRKFGSRSNSFAARSRSRQ